MNNYIRKQPRNYPGKRKREREREIQCLGDLTGVFSLITSNSNSNKSFPAVLYIYIYIKRRDIIPFEKLITTPTKSKQRNNLNRASSSEEKNGKMTKSISRYSLITHHCRNLPEDHVHDVADHTVVSDRMLRGLADRSQQALSAGVAGATGKEGRSDGGRHAKDPRATFRVAVLFVSSLPRAPKHRTEVPCVIRACVCSRCAHDAIPECPEWS